MALTDPRHNYKPFEYEQAHKFSSDQQDSFWVAKECALTEDLLDWKVKLDDKERAVVAGVLKGFTQSELVIGDYWANVVRWFPKPEIAIMARTFSFFECFDEETDLLTTEGWIRCKDITMQHKIAQYDIETKEITFAYPSKTYQYRYTGVMHHYNSKSMNLMVTPNHELITIHPHTKKATKRRSDKSKLGRNYLLPISGYGCGSSPELSVEEQLLIAIAADGCLRGLCPSAEGRDWRTVDFNLTKQRKINRLKELLDLAGWEYAEREVNTESKKTVFQFLLPKEYDVKQVKNLGFLNIETMSAKKAKQAIEEVLLWDGTATKDFAGHYYSTNKEAVEKIQAVAALGGISSVIGINRTAQQSKEMTMPQGNKPKSTKTCYTVSLSDRFQTTYPYKKEVEYDGYVYCVSVEKQNVVSRRGGRIAITGNCIHTEAYSYLSDTLGLDDFEAFLQDPAAKAKYDNLISARDESEQDIARSLAVFSAFAEGVSLFSSFAVLMRFPALNKLKGLGTIIEYSSRDECLHAEAGIWLFNTYLEENPHLKTDKLESDIYEAARTCVGLEEGFIDSIFDQGDLLGLRALDLKNYIRARANQKLVQLGYKPILEFDPKSAEAISGWFDVFTGGARNHDFFLTRETNYTRGDAFDPNELDFNF